MTKRERNLKKTPHSVILGTGNIHTRLNKMLCVLWSIYCTLNYCRKPRKLQLTITVINLHEVIHRITEMSGTEK